jgi:hypothetical protein
MMSDEPCSAFGTAMQTSVIAQPQFVPTIAAEASVVVGRHLDIASEQPAVSLNDGDALVETTVVSAHRCPFIDFGKSAAVASCRNARYANLVPVSIYALVILP